MAIKMQLYYICTFLMVLSAYKTCEAASGVQVTYTHPGGKCDCQGLEIRTPGPGPRTLRITCKQSNSITCMYKGNPHGCSAYNNNGQKKFYQQSLNDVGKRVCSLSPMICPKGRIGNTKICEDLGVGKYFIYISGP